MPRAILFDAAGTLIELTRPVGERYSEIAVEHGVALPAWRLEDAFHRVFRNMPTMCFPAAADDEIEALERGWWRELVRQTFQATDSTARFDDFEGFFGALWDAFASPACWRNRPGVPETLGLLRASGASLGVVSNFDHRLPHLLEQLGILQEIACLVLPGTHRVAKPDPRVFAPALAALGAAPSAAVYVGDDQAVDGAAAIGAGLRFVDASGLTSLAELPGLLG
jgi:putative hydrolase of the HAD superfamily